MEFINFLFNNWTILISAPLVFLSFMILAVVFSWLAIQFIYRERIARKDEWIEEYRQRLHLVDTDKTSYSKLTNKELKTKAVNLIYQMREYLSKKTIEENKYKAIMCEAFWKSKSNEQKDKIVAASFEPIIQLKSSNMLEYAEKFQTKAILIRDELLSRLPKNQKDNTYYKLYPYVSNPSLLKMVIDDLERLSKSLPK